MRFSEIVLALAVVVTSTIGWGLEVIVDNSDAAHCTLTGTWTTQTSNCYGTNRFTTTPGTGTKKVAWDATVPAGWYKIDFYVNSNTTYATDAHYSIIHRDGTAALTVTQRRTSTGWAYLGVYYFNGTASISLTDQFSAGSPVVADAIRLQSVFSFVHMSDSHIGYSNGTVAATNIAAELKTLGKVQMAGYGFEAPPPSFAIHTGDITEYGQEYWASAMSIFSGVPFPIYYTMGNHDATQNSLREKIRSLQGSACSSFDYSAGGRTFHFVLFDSTILQSPRAGFSREGLDWLKADLAAQPANTPMFVCIHHPIDGASDPKPFDNYRLLETMRPFNNAMLLYGHGHSFVTSVFDSLRILEGGSTYNDTTVNGGYNIVTIVDNLVYVARKDYGAATAATGLVSGWMIHPTVGYPAIGVASPSKEFIDRNASVSLSTNISSATLPMTDVRYELDGDASWQTLAGSGLGSYTGSMNFASAIHGRHWVRFRYTTAAGIWYRTQAFWAWDDYPKPRWIFDLGAASLAVPTVVNNRVYVGADGGKFRCIHARYGTEIWNVQLPGDIVSSAAVMDGNVIFGCSDGKVYCLDAGNGTTLWSTPCSGAVYSTPTVDNGTVYIGSNGTGLANSAALYALDITNGAIKWTFPVGCAIESKPCVLGDTVYAGAWDSYLYAVRASDGTQKWRYQHNASRYYSPADSWPVASSAANRVFVADRQWIMNAVDCTAGTGSWTQASIAGQCLTPDGTALLQATSTGPLRKTDFTNGTIWESANIGLDATPINPTAAGSYAAMINGNGLLTVLNVNTGATEYQFQASQGYQVCSAAVDDTGDAYVCTYDGYLLRVGNKPLPVLDAADQELVVEARTSTGSLSADYIDGSSWGDSTARSAAYGLVAPGSRYQSLTNGITGTATFTPNFQKDGTYDVYATWNSSSNAKNVSFIINHFDGQARVYADQKPAACVGGSNCNVYYKLGTYRFAAGKDPAKGTVTIDESTVTGPVSDYNTGRVYADGLLFARVGEFPVTLSRLALE